MDTLKIGFLDDCMVIMWVLMWPASVDKCYFEFEILKDKNWLSECIYLISVMTHDACIFLNMGTFRPFFVILVAAIVLSFFLTFLFKSFARIMFNRSARED